MSTRPRSLFPTLSRKATLTLLLAALPLLAVACSSSGSGASDRRSHCAWPSNRGSCDDLRGTQFVSRQASVPGRWRELRPLPLLAASRPAARAPGPPAPRRGPRRGRPVWRRPAEPPRRFLRHVDRRPDLDRSYRHRPHAGRAIRRAGRPLGEHPGRRPSDDHAPARRDRANATGLWNWRRVDDDRELANGQPRAPAQQHRLQRDLHRHARQRGHHRRMGGRGVPLALLAGSGPVQGQRGRHAFCPGTTAARRLGVAFTSSRRRRGIDGPGPQHAIRQLRDPTGSASGSPWTGNTIGNFILSTDLDGDLGSPSRAPGGRWTSACRQGHELHGRPAGRGPARGGAQATMTSGT